MYLMLERIASAAFISCSVERDVSMHA